MLVSLEDTQSSSKTSCGRQQDKAAQRRGDSWGCWGPTGLGTPLPGERWESPLSFGPQSHCVNLEVEGEQTSKGPGNLWGTLSLAWAGGPSVPLGRHFLLIVLVLRVPYLSWIGPGPQNMCPVPVCLLGYVTQWPLHVACSLDPPRSLLGSVCGVLGSEVLSLGCWHLRCWSHTAGVSDCEF